MTSTEVLNGESRWSVEQSDALEFLAGLPADSVDLVFTSPPYLAARTYGIGADIADPEKWTAWMVEFVRAASRVCRGLIAVNCEGQTKDFRYLPTPFLLAADLHRAGFNLRKPCVYERDGISGSGGPDWLKNRWEPIVCVTRPGKLAWSDNTACGKPPKFIPGGNPSHRNANGERRQKMKQLVSTGLTQRAAARVAGVFMAGITSGVDDGGTVGKSTYVPPDIANPGNIIDCGANTHFGFGNESEAPFPLDLPAFFIKSFCPPDGIVCDPFAGSGTTAHAALEHGRKFVGCDVRQSQCDLTRRRMRTVTPCLPLEAVPS